jgi:hypothetical protein
MGVAVTKIGVRDLPTASIARDGAVATHRLLAQ